MTTKRFVRIMTLNKRKDIFNERSFDGEWYNDIEGYCLENVLK